MFSRGTVRVLSEYEVLFWFYFRIRFPDKSFHKGGQKKKKIIWLLSSLLYIYIKPAQMVSKINIFITNPDRFSILISILLSFEKT
jgi:hypothetical protein